jgi:hypothetical protein
VGHGRDLGRGTLKRSAAGAIGAVAALAIGFKLALFLGDCRDLALDDEALYLASGVRWGVPGYPNGANGLPSADWSPLYSFWYRLLFVFERDRVALYDLSACLVVVGLTGAVYFLQRRVGVSPLVSLVVSFFFATSWVFEVPQYAMHFAMIIAFAGASLAASARRWSGALVVLTGAFVLGAYARPELALSAMLCAAVWLVNLVRRREGLWGVANVGLAAVLLRTLGNPLGGGRAFYAFGQHYAFGVIARQKLSTNPWFQWYGLVERDFGPVSGIGAAMRANPRAFASHVGHNLLDFPLGLVGITEPVLGVPAALGAVVWGIVLAVGAVCLISAWHRWRRSRRSVAMRVLALVTVALALPACASVAIIHTRDHYLVPLAALLAVWIGVGVSRSSRSRLGAMVAAAALLLLVTPNRAHGWCLQTAIFGGRVAKRLPVRATVRALRSLGIRRHVVGLELAWGYFFYAGLDVERVVEWAKDEPFFAYLRHRDISVIVLTRDFLAHPKFRPDEQFRAFFAHPEPSGYRVVVVPGTKSRIAVRRDLDTP